MPRHRPPLRQPCARSVSWRGGWAGLTPLSIPGAALAMLWLATAASAITINLSYDEDLTPAWDPTGALLMQHAHAAAEMWSGYFNEDYSVNINISWASLEPGFLGLATSSNDIYLQGNLANMPRDDDEVPLEWYLDPAPSDHGEFDFTNTDLMQSGWSGQSLVRHLQPAQRASYFGGNAPMLMEIGYRGLASPASGALGRFDLFSTVVHEIGHVLGVNSGWDGSWIVPAWQLGGESVEIYQDDGHVVSRRSLMCGECGTVHYRRMPSTVDILAVAAAQGWTNIDLPRQDFLGGTHWLANVGYVSGLTAWEGGHAPDGDDQAYLRHGGTVTLGDDVTVGQLLIDDDSGLVTDGRMLSVNDTLVLGEDADPGLRVDAGSFVEAFEARIHAQLRVDASATFETWQTSLGAQGHVQLEGGTLRAQHLVVDGPGEQGDGGQIVGHGIIDVGGTFNNNGQLVVDGGSLLLWSTSGVGVWNIGGSDGTGVVSAMNENLTILGPHLSFNGEMFIGINRTVSINHEAWRLGPGGSLHLAGSGNPATFRAFGGDGSAIIQGHVKVTGLGVLDLPVTFEPTASVQVDGFTDRLVLLGPTTFRGGTYVGDGIIEQIGDATVEADTVINVGIYDFDGDETNPSTTTIAPGAMLTVIALGIELDLTNEYDGTLSINGGVLAMNTHERFSAEPVPWTLARPGRLNLQHNGAGGLVKGSPVTVQGQILATGVGNRIDADVAFDAGAVVALADAASELTLAGETTFAGGNYTGPGVLRQQGDAHVVANTTINVATYDWDGSGAEPSSTTVAPGVSLHLNVDAIDTAGNAHGGTITLHDDAMLRIDTPGPWEIEWYLDLHDATVAGSELTNHGTIAGTGTIETRVHNHGLISPGHSAGGMLIDADFSQHDPGTLLAEIGGTLIDEHDWLAITGHASLGGELHLELIDGFVPALQDTLTILAAGGGISGGFANVSSGQRLDTLDGLGSFLVQYGPGSPTNPDHVVLTTFELDVLLGDMNLDGTVDTGDVAPFVLALTDPAAYEAQYGIDPGLVGDINQDGSFDTGDVAAFVQLLVNPDSAIPEPGSLALLAVGGLMLLRRQRCP